MNGRNRQTDTKNNNTFNMSSNNLQGTSRKLPNQQSKASVGNVPSTEQDVKAKQFPTGESPACSGASPSWQQRENTRRPAQKMKLVMIGDSGVGKSMLAYRFTNPDKFDYQAHPTIGVDLWIRDMVVDGTPYKVTLFDASGEESLMSIASNHFDFADAIILVYDCTYKYSFASLVDWLRAARRYADPSTRFFIIGTKFDRPEVQEVAATTIDILAAKEGLSHLETSALTGEGVEEAFSEIVRAVKRPPSPEHDEYFQMAAPLYLRESPPEGRWFCCF